MANTGVLIEIGDDGIKEANFGVITAARQSNANELYAFVLDRPAQAYKNTLAEYGVKKIVELSSDAADFGASPDLQAGALAAAMNQFDITALLGLSSARGRDLLARLAALIDAPLVQDCIRVNPAEKTVTKSHFSGRTLATVKLNGTPCLYGVRPNTVEPQKAPCEAEMVAFRATLKTSSRVAVKETRRSNSGRMDLTEANVIITGGRPLGAPENFKILEECAEAMGAAVGASRAAVDAGYAPHSMQVGQTGKTVSPKLYIGCGLSGSVQHFAGMKTSKIIVGINTDRDAPIFSKCDYGIVGDLFEVVPMITQVIKAQK